MNLNSMDRKEINFDEKRLNELYEGKKTIKPYVLRSMINYYENRQQKKIIHTHQFHCAIEL